MNKTFLMGCALTGLGFFIGCGAPEAPPPGDPALENIDDASAYDVPANPGESSAAPSE